jgi:hypothetical protein
MSSHLNRSSTEHTSKEQNRSAEAGSALLIAVICLAVLLTISIGASQFHAASGRDSLRHTQAGQEDWNSRAAAETVEAGVRVDIPSAYQKEVRMARAVPNTNSLPAFDTPSISSSAPIYDPASWVVTYSSAGQMTVSGHQVASSGTGRSSLLGNLSTWLSAHKPVPVSYAALQGYTASQVGVALLEELYRQPQTGPGTEPAYVIRFAVDARGGAEGRTRTPGEIVLGPASAPCAPPVINSFGVNPNNPTDGQPFTLSWNVANVAVVTLTSGNFYYSGPPVGSVQQTQSAGTYNYTLTASNSCGSATQTLSVTVATSSGGGGGPTPGTSTYWCDSTSVGTTTVSSNFNAVAGTQWINVSGSISITSPDGFACQPIGTVGVDPNAFSPPSVSLVIMGGNPPFQAFPATICCVQYVWPTVSFDVTVSQLFPVGTQFGDYMSYQASVQFCTPDGSCCFTSFFAASPAYQQCR